MASPWTKGPYAAPWPFTSLAPPGSSILLVLPTPLQTSDPQAPPWSADLPAPSLSFLLFFKKEGIIYFFESTPTTRKEKLGHGVKKENTKTYKRKLIYTLYSKMYICLLLFNLLQCIYPFPWPFLYHWFHSTWMTPWFPGTGSNSILRSFCVTLVSTFFSSALVFQISHIIPIFQKTLKMKSSWTLCIWFPLFLFSLPVSISGIC